MPLSGATMSISIEPVGFVRAARENPEDDFWGASEAFSAAKGPC
jgi:hypothetical protein